MQPIAKVRRRVARALQRTETPSVEPTGTTGTAEPSGTAGAAEPTAATAPAPPAPPTSTTPGRTVVAPVLATPPRNGADLAAWLISQGEPVAAVDALVVANRRVRSPELEIGLVEARRVAAEHLAASAPVREPWPPHYDDPFPEVSGALPEVTRDGLDVAVVGGAVAHHGAVLVRGLFSSEQAAAVREVIDLAHDARAAGGGAVRAGSAFRPVETASPYKTEILRNMVMTHGGVWLADSPRATAVALDALTEAGAVDVLTEHFGARPFFSLQKSTLRRSQPEERLVAWHQDGSFYDPDVRTMNIWVALTPCGGDRPTPALEVVPRRMEGILPVDGVMSQHSIDYGLVEEITDETPSVIPAFEPGDALIFDERLLHRTHLPNGMTDVRYALECWFFAPSHATSSYVPLLV